MCQENTPTPLQHQQPEPESVKPSVSSGVDAQ